MKKLIQKPYLFFFGFMPILLFIGLFFKSKTINIAYYGGIFPISFWSLCLVSTFFFLLIGCNYIALKWFDKEPKKTLTIIHFSLQILSFGLLLYVLKISEKNLDLDVVSFLFLISFLIFLLSVFVHFINFIASIFLKKE